MPEQNYARVEFTADLGSGPFVVAFVDFSGQGISFGGPPLNVQIHEGTPDDQSEDLAVSEYQRVTVHADGRVETHLPTSAYVPGLGELDQDKPPLAQWAAPWCRRFEFTWAPGYKELIQPWLAKPKPGTHSACRNVPVEFNPEAINTVMHICVVKPSASVSDLSLMIPLPGQLWALTSGWPWVLVHMSNVKCPGVDNLTNVGRNYQ